MKFYIKKIYSINSRKTFSKIFFLSLELFEDVIIYSFKIY